MYHIENPVNYFTRYMRLELAIRKYHSGSKSSSTESEEVEFDADLELMEIGDEIV